MEKVFKALADSNRRKILDLLKNEPGMTLSELCQEFDFSRYAVMQHIRVLEEADLVVKRREGKYKLHYLNPIPLKLIQDRWLSDFTSFWAEGLTKLKRSVDKNDKS